MNRAETVKIMAVLRGAYPGYYKGIDSGELNAVVALWTEMFEDEPYGLVAGAVKRLIACDTKGFPPVIGQIKEQIYRLTHIGEMTEQEAWGKVARAVKGGDCDKYFAELPEDIRRIVGSPAQLAQWGRTEEDVFQSVIASNFQRSYRARAAENRELAKVPQDIKALADSLFKRLEG